MNVPAGIPDGEHGRQSTRSNARFEVSELFLGAVSRWPGFLRAQFFRSDGVVRVVQTEGVGA
jgi:hypothetical protein